jgi:hypothetical protein
MKDIDKLAELGESHLSLEMEIAYNDLSRQLNYINDASERKRPLFVCLEDLPNALESYRSTRSKFIDYGLEVFPYDVKIIFAGRNMKAIPLTQEGIEECLPSDMKEDYKIYCDYREKQFAEWDAEPQI